MEYSYTVNIRKKPNTPYTAYTKPTVKHKSICVTSIRVEKHHLNINSLNSNIYFYVTKNPIYKSNEIFYLKYNKSLKLQIQ